MSRTSMMQAVFFDHFGTAAETLKSGEIPKPVANAGEVLVRMKCSGVNPSDVKKRAGAFPNLLDDGFVIPHSDGAGIIEAVGSGVSNQRIGERVWVYQAQFARRFGTAAQYLSIDSSRAAVLPDRVPFDVGACLGIPVMTSHRCVFADGPVEGKTILITGGAGRVGYYAIQWAKLAGASVITTASNEQDKALCLTLGADLVINHRLELWGEELLSQTAGKKVDRVIDVEFGANLPEVLKVISVGGTIATYSSSRVGEPRLPFLQMMYLDLNIRLIIVYAMPESAKLAAIEDINKKLEANLLKHRISHRLGWDSMVQAHELIEKGGAGGAVVVDIVE